MFFVAGKIQVILTPSHLTVSNTGAPLSKDGVKALMGSHRSTKEGKIGRFGLGFKSLLHLNGKVTIFSRGGENIQFDPGKCRNELFREFGEKKVPGFRLAWGPATGSAVLPAGGAAGAALATPTMAGRSRRSLIM